MYRNYIVPEFYNLTIELNKDNDFILEHKIDIIDMIILDYVLHLPILIQNKNNLDGPFDLEFIWDNNTLYFELNYLEFTNIYPYVANLITKEDFTNRIKRLEESNLLNTVQGETAKLYTIASDTMNAFNF